MFSTLTRLANSIFPYRFVVYLAIVFTLCLLIFNLQDVQIAFDDQRLVTYFVALIWLLLFNTLLHVFYQPNSIPVQLNWWGRMKQRFSVYCQKILFIVFIGITVVALYLSMKLLTL